MLSILEKLVDAGQFGIVSLIFVVLLILILTVCFVVYKFLSRIHLDKFKGKIAGQEIEFTTSNDNKIKNIQAAALPTSKTDMPTFISTLQQIIDYSVENGNQASLKRQQLYDTQMRHIREKFDMIKTIIIFNYSNTVRSSELIRIILDYSFNTAIINKLEYICKADRLIERDQSKLVEEHRSLIDSGYVNLVNELKKYSEKVSASNDFQLSFLDDSLFKIVETQKNDIAAAITECLQYCWDEANSYFNELKELRQQLSANVTNALKSYLSSDQHEKIPTEWYSSDKLPPNEIVGASI